jgi:hypothetical protein
VDIVNQVFQILVGDVIHVGLIVNGDQINYDLLFCRIFFYQDFYLKYIGDYSQSTTFAFTFTLYRQSNFVNVLVN